MSKIKRVYSITVSILIAAAILVFILMGCGESSTSTTSSVQPKSEEHAAEELSIIGEIVDGKHHTIPAFSFTNQNGATITDKEYEGKIYVADFFFTTCPSICPIMTRSMVRIQDRYKKDEEIRFLSHTINPEEDSPEVLKEYADRMGVQDGWNLVTGSKKDLYTQAIKGYLVPVEEMEEKIEESFVHSEMLILIDKESRIRGFYSGIDSMQVEKLITDIQLLKSSYQGE